jgi:S-disulfanyl-L-cysteine oxidoreductase SoxD
VHNKIPLLLAATTLIATAVMAQNNPRQVGRTLNPELVKQWDITVLPNGEGLPEGSGTSAQGEKLYTEKCASCHGENGEGKGPVGPALVGGIGTLATSKPVKTIGSYWPYATSVWDYIHRSMPYDAPGTLSANETYAITAFLLFRNGIIPNELAMNKDSLPKVRMPNRDGFIADSRPDVGKPKAGSTSRQ